MDSTGIRRLSKLLLGNIYRVEIGAAIHAWGDEPLTSTTLSDYTGIRYPRVAEELGRLRSAELLVGGRRTDGSVEYKAIATAYWEMCATLLEEWKGTNP